MREVRKANVRRGSVKFVLIHHGACAGGPFHHRIGTDGVRTAELDEAERGQHPRSIGVVVQGDFDSAAPSGAQLKALKHLLVELKLRFPAIELGTHRQVRGGPSTTCPGRRFPMQALREWYGDGLLRERDAALRYEFEVQYSRLASK